jgi:hypothetical protein
MILRVFRQGTGVIGASMLIALGWAIGASPAAASGDSAVTRLEMSLRQPEVAKVGRNRFKVVVEDAYGQPLKDAEVSITLYRRGVPGSKGYIEHPVRTKLRLKPGEEAGVYETIGPLVASGLWDVKMEVKPRGDHSRTIESTTKIWADD